jgi:hypothetical protein
MAASACDRLGTILGSVANLRATVSQACATASQRLPELSENKNRAVHIHFEGLCSSNATRLKDVESHLDSALVDWERFIKHNCSGSECADIGRRLALQRSRLLERGVNAGTEGCQASAAGNESNPDHQKASQQLRLTVSGVTTEINRNGTWVLRRISEDFWECDIYALRKDTFGWFVEDRRNAESYFFRQGVNRQCGVYERCEVCPHDGNAVVFSPIESQSTAPSGASPTPNSDPKTIVDLALSLDDYIQHEIQDHNISREQLLDAIRESSNLSELAAFLGSGCPRIVSPCALPALNLIRGALERPAFIYDKELHQKLCLNAKAQHVSNGTDKIAVEAKGND